VDHLKKDQTSDLVLRLNRLSEIVLVTRTSTSLHQKLQLIWTIQSNWQFHNFFLTETSDRGHGPMGPGVNWCPTFSGMGWLGSTYGTWMLGSDATCTT